MSREAMRRRTRSGGRPVDIGATVAQIQDCYLEAARRADVTIRAAQAADLAAIAGAAAKAAGGGSADDSGGTATARHGRGK
eukprot:2875955-Pleurochrysis_carterae.AAC.1